MLCLCCDLVVLCAAQTTVAQEGYIIITIVINYKKSYIRARPRLS